MRGMQTIVTDVRGVCPPVCLSHGSTRFHCAKTAKRTKTRFRVNTLRSTRNVVLDVDPDHPQQAKGGFDAAFAKLLWPLVKTFHRRQQSMVLSGR